MNANKDVRNSLKKMRQHLNGEQVTESNIVKAPLLDMREMLKRARKMNGYRPDSSRVSRFNTGLSEIPNSNN